MLGGGGGGLTSGHAAGLVRDNSVARDPGHPSGRPTKLWFEC